MHTRQEQLEAFSRMLDVLNELREKCPWDRKQTNESLRPNTIEEVYELCDALMKSDEKEICKELGDVLLHVCFYAKLADEKEQFDIADVCNRLCDKLIFRHPHVYPPSDIAAAGLRQGIKIETASDVTMQWEQLKLLEKDGNETQVWEKVKEELAEFEAEVENMDKDKAEAEFGDLMFSLINAARLYKINPDNALERTNQKFIRRFNYLESQTLKKGRKLTEMSLEEMDKYWEEAKRLEQE